MVQPAGLEPAISAFGGRRPIQLDDGCISGMDLDRGPTPAEILALCASLPLPVDETCREVLNRIQGVAPCSPSQASGPFVFVMSRKRFPSPSSPPRQGGEWDCCDTPERTRTSI